MSSVIIYVDESGDLGWKFTSPYRAGGSSRYLTISGLVVPSEMKHHPERVIRDLYSARGWSTSKEKKWSDMSDAARHDFVERALKLKTKFKEVSYHVMVVRKEKVRANLRQDANLLYNYMLKLGLVAEMKAHSQVTLVPDPRTIKIESGNSLHDYLQINLWYTENVDTKLITKPTDSKKTLGLQFADMLAGAAQHHFEDGNSDFWKRLAPEVKITRLFF